jgi:hypothetical protein
MKRYFFDLVGRQGSQYDYRGGYFRSLEKAQQLAELIALDLGIEPEGEWSGYTIAVLNAHGQQFFSVPVQEFCSAAA